jgi:hypothetical protein
MLLKTIEITYNLQCNNDHIKLIKSDSLALYFKKCVQKASLIEYMFFEYLLNKPLSKEIKSAYSSCKKRKI